MKTKEMRRQASTRQRAEVAVVGLIDELNTLSSIRQSLATESAFHALCTGEVYNMVSLPET